MKSSSTPLMSVAQLADILAAGATHLRIVDASWYLPNANRDAYAEYQKSAIPGAIFWDVDAIADVASPYPHMLPSPSALQAWLQALGIGPHDAVVVYDSAGLFSAARVWWALRVAQHTAPVWVLDGGLPAWQHAHLPCESGMAARIPAIVGDSNANMRAYNTALVADHQTVSVALGDGSSQIVDARAAARFQGSAPEPRAGVRAGHMPGAMNLPFQALLTPDEPQRLLPPDALRRVLSAHGVDVGRLVIASCGSGVTACIVALAWEVLGLPPVCVYDGAWAEWGSLPDTPVIATA